MTGLGHGLDAGKRGHLRLDHTAWGDAGSGNGQTHSRSARLSGGGPREVGEAWDGLPEFSWKSRVAFFANNAKALKRWRLHLPLCIPCTGLSEPPGLSKPLLASLEQSGSSLRWSLSRVVPEETGAVRT